MKLLTLTLPGFDNNLNLSNKDFSANYRLGKSIFDLPSLIGTALNLVLAGMALLMLYNMALGAFRYVTAGDSKDSVTKARQRIMWSVVGFVFILGAFAVSQYLQTALPTASSTPLTIVSPPPANQPNQTKIDSSADGIGGCCDPGAAENAQNGCPSGQTCTTSNGACTSSLSCQTP